MTSERSEIEKWAVTILGDNPNWRESGDCELVWQSWQARAALATQPAVPEQYEYWCIAHGCWRPIQKLVEFLTDRGFKVRAMRGAEHGQ